MSKEQVPRHTPEQLPAISADALRSRSGLISAIGDRIYGGGWAQLAEKTRGEDAAANTFPASPEQLTLASGETLEMKTEEIPTEIHPNNTEGQRHPQSDEKKAKAEALKRKQENLNEVQELLKKLNTEEQAGIITPMKIDLVSPKLIKKREHYYKKAQAVLGKMPDEADNKDKDFVYSTELFPPSPNTPRSKMEARLSRKLAIGHQRQGEATGWIIPKQIVDPELTEKRRKSLSQHNSTVVTSDGRVYEAFEKVLSEKGKEESLQVDLNSEKDWDEVPEPQMRAIISHLKHYAHGRENKGAG